MKIVKFKKEDFKQSTLNTSINEFDENYLANLVTSISGLNYNVNDAYKLINEISSKTNYFDLGFFIDFVTNNKEYIEIVYLQELDYSLRSRIENRLSYAMSSSLEDLSRNGKEELGNFSAEISRNKIDKRYMYKGTYIFADSFYGKAVEKTNLDEIKENIATLNKIKDEAEELFKKYYKK